MSSTTYRDAVLSELKNVPDEYLPFVLQFIRSFQNNVLLKPAASSLKQGWQEALSGEIYPVADLWEDVDAE